MVLIKTGITALKRFILLNKYFVASLEVVGWDLVSLNPSMDLIVKYWYVLWKVFWQSRTSFISSCLLLSLLIHKGIRCLISGFLLASWQTVAFLRWWPVHNFIQIRKELFILGQREVDVLWRGSYDQAFTVMTIVMMMGLLWEINLPTLLLNLLHRTSRFSPI